MFSFSKYKMFGSRHKMSPVQKPCFGGLCFWLLEYSRYPTMFAAGAAGPQEAASQDRPGLSHRHSEYVHVCGSLTWYVCTSTLCSLPGNTWGPRFQLLRDRVPLISADVSRFFYPSGMYLCKEAKGLCSAGVTLLLQRAAVMQG